ncbi:MAG: nicotinate (nicotinamide) nucleotide adenylyltransferase [Planctomycetota bacterium]
MDSPRRILVFGGTFDPPHRAHTTLPPLVADRLGCETILYVPAALNPLKTERPPTEARHRLAMLRLALREVTNASICRLELERGGPSYTVDTLEALRGRYGPHATLRLLIGADQALQFHDWKDWQRILDLAEPVVMLRPPATEAGFREQLARIYDEAEVEAWIGRVVHLPQIEVSATDLRSRLTRGGPVEDDLDPDVVAYIQREGLYRQAPS